MIINCVDKEWLAELQSKAMGFHHRTPKEMLEYLQNNGGDLYHLDVTELITMLQKPWGGIEAPATFL